MAIEYFIAGTINGHYATGGVIYAYTVDGQLVGTASADLGVTEYEIICNSADAHFIVCIFNVGNQWTNRRWRTIGELVYPIDAETYPYYYECVRVGFSGTNSPEWSANPQHLINDGSTIWKMVEQLPQPIIEHPITPSQR